MKHLILALAMLAAPLAAGAARADVPPTMGTTACGGTEPAHIVPIAATHVLPPYPPVSVRLDEQGNSILRVAIAPNGTVVDDSIVQSSGSERLDAAALDFVKQTWRWQPMPQCRTPVSVAVSIAWRLKNPPASPIDPALMVKLMRFIAAPPGAWPPGMAKSRSVVMLMGSISETGQWRKLMSLPGLGDPALVDASDGVIGTHKWSAPMLDGKVVPGIAIIGVVWTPPGEKPVDPEQLPGMIEMMMPHNNPPPPAP